MYALLTNKQFSFNLCFQAALTYQQDQLALKCLSMIEQNPEAVFKTRGFTELSDEALSFILRSDNLMADEGEILKAVKEWATVNSVSQKNISITFVETVEF